MVCIAEKTDDYLTEKSEGLKIIKPGRFQHVNYLLVYIPNRFLITRVNANEN